MNSQAIPPTDPDGEEPLDPLLYRAHLYQALNRLWLFPSLGAFWILGSSTIDTSIRETLFSSRIENIAAILLLVGQIVFLVQSRRFHQLNQNQGSAKFRH